jgi:hypothetical protein
MFRIDRYRLPFLLLFLAGKALSQAVPDSTGPSRFSLGAGIGYSFKTYYAEGIPYHGRGGGAALARIDWRAASFFGFGFEAGWVTIAAESPTVYDTRLGASEAAMRLDAFPATLQIFFTSRWGELRVGLGAALVRSSIDAWGQRSGAERISVVYTASYGYAFPISDRWALQPGVAVFAIPDIDLILFAPNLRCRYAL